MDEQFTIEYYETDTGRCPYLDWEDELTMELRAQIRKRLNRGQHRDIAKAKKYWQDLGG